MLEVEASAAPTRSAKDVRGFVEGGAEKRLPERSEPTLEVGSGAALARSVKYVGESLKGDVEPNNFSGG
jgi:hypothetical protein